MRNLLLLLFVLSFIYADAQSFTKVDSLRGTITEERAWWDLKYYHLEVEVIPERKWIQGKNLIRYEVLHPHNVIQIDLQPPLKITKVMQDGMPLEFTSSRNAHFVQLKKDQIVADINELEVFYEGNPRPAIRAPWDGGFSWRKDKTGNEFIATSCQGLGASVWWPCKDHMYDEVDSMRISAEVPDHLQNVSNGRLESVDRNKKKNTRTFHWVVRNPINNYGVNLNIGDYVTWNEVYNGEKGELDVTYWALKEDEEKARVQYQQVPKMLEAFEHWFGPYPFYEDGYQIVQAPYLGMEHQSSVTYGNQFMNGYLGRDLSQTGWGLKFDFIIIHESGHEWFANNITHKDMADMWLHESFTNYSESLFLEYYYGKEVGQEYVRGLRAGIENKKPMIGTYGVNDETYPTDVYPKGANMLNTMRTIVNNDDRWKLMLRELNRVFYHKTVTSAQVERFIISCFKVDLEGFFDQYLRDRRIPTFEYYFSDGSLNYRWSNCLDNFDMPLRIKLNGVEVSIYPSTMWDKLETQANDLTIDPNYYISTFKLR